MQGRGGTGGSPWTLLSRRVVGRGAELPNTEEAGMVSPSPAKGIRRVHQPCELTAEDVEKPHLVDTDAKSSLSFCHVSAPWEVIEGWVCCGGIK